MINLDPTLTQIWDTVTSHFPLQIHTFSSGLSIYACLIPISYPQAPDIHLYIKNIPKAIAQQNLLLLAILMAIVKYNIICIMNICNNCSSL